MGKHEGTSYERTLEYEKNWEKLLQQGNIQALAAAAADYLIAYEVEEESLVDLTAIDSAIDLLSHIEKRAQGQQDALALLQEMFASFSMLHTAQSLHKEIDAFYPRMKAILIEQGYLTEEEREVL